MIGSRKMECVDFIGPFRIEKNDRYDLGSATEPPTIYQIDLYVFNLERIRSLFGPSALVACLTLRTQSDIDFAR